jgi:hypothetical protein
MIRFSPPPPQIDVEYWPVMQLTREDYIDRVQIAGFGETKRVQMSSLIFDRIGGQSAFRHYT